MSIFADNAPLYWNAGIAVMPLRERMKEPFLLKWQGITLKTVQNAWLTTYANCNIGLPLGHGTGFAALDVDTDDRGVMERVWSLFGETPYLRVGKKGYAALYRTQGATKSKRIHAEDGSMLVELLGDRTQLVLPPSIHPDTGKPYTSNVNLWEVVNDLPTLPTNAGEILLENFGRKKRKSQRQPRTGGVAVGGRHNDMASYLGSLRAKGIVDPSEIEALAHMRNATYEEALPADEVADLIRAAAEDWEGGDGLPYTDLGNAVRLVRRLDGKARYVSEWGRWVVWDGTRWVPDSQGYVMRKAKEVGRALVGEIN